MHATHEKLEIEPAKLAIALFQDCVQRKVLPFSHWRPPIIILNKSTFHGSSYTTEHQALGAEAVKIVFPLNGQSA